ncbi:hypothetical protein WJX74_004416 [Apatococcus lobatus]|uniref:Nucleolar protein 16 n=1 Tax=Apatococcus lobatus TaxID=904363 RepID=A0AAW1RSE1_9CHLO
MGGSRRKLKKTIPVVSRKKRRNASATAAKKLPAEIKEARPSMPEKLGSDVDWHTEQRFKDNYAAAGLMPDPNFGFGRNATPNLIEAAMARDAADDAQAESDDDLRAAEGKMRRSGPAAVQPLTANQQQIITRLLDAHGDDTHAMSRDRKLNVMLLPPARLRKMIESHAVFAGRSGVRCSFRAPKHHG